jgi:hypothetical protein
MKNNPKLKKKFNIEISQFTFTLEKSAFRIKGMVVPTFSADMIPIKMLDDCFQKTKQSK